MQLQSGNRKINILINLSSMLLCEALRELLSADRHHYETVAVTDSRAAGDFQPDNVIVDSHTLLQQHLSRWPEAKIILIDTGSPQEEIISQLLAHKIYGVISTNTNLRLFRKALKAINNGQVWVDNGKLKALLLNPPSPMKGGETLSKKEQEIISLISQGRRNREIAEKLCISEQTVKTHISRIFKKVNVSNRSQLVPLAMKLMRPEMH